MQFEQADGVMKIGTELADSASGADAFAIWLIITGFNLHHADTCHAYSCKRILCKSTAGQEVCLLSPQLPFCNDLPTLRLMESIPSCTNVL